MTAFRHRVRYHEVDQQGFLFNGRYFEISDVAMTEFFRTLGWSYGELNDMGADPSVVHVEADFSAPARFDDVLAVQASCTHVGRSSFTLRTELNGENGTVAVISTVYVNVDAREGTSRPLPEPVLNVLRGALGTAGDDEEGTAG